MEKVYETDTESIIYIGVCRYRRVDPEGDEPLVFCCECSVMFGHEGYEQGSYLYEEYLTEESDPKKVLPILSCWKEK